MNARKWLEELEIMVVAKVGKTPTMGVFTSAVLEITSQLLSGKDKRIEELESKVWELEKSRFPEYNSSLNEAWNEKMDRAHWGMDKRILCHVK